jgi:hypothetical protein
LGEQLSYEQRDAGGAPGELGVGIGFVIKASDAVLAWADAFFARRVAEAVGWKQEMSERVA